MNKNFKKVMSLIACTAIAASMAGCNGKTGTSGGALVDGTGGKITKEPTELTLFLIKSGDVHVEDTEVMKAIAEKTNVSIKTVSSKSASDEDTAFNMLMASGDLPDIVAYNQSKKAFPKYGMEGAFAPLNDLLEEYGPNILKAYENPSVRAHVTSADGNIYFLTGVNPPTVSSGWFVRQDWMDKLGLKAPTTVEEYHDALLAFRTQDPNGNGVQDEVPYLSRFAGVDHLVLLFDTITNWELRDGKPVYGPTTPEFKTAYENIVKWYAEGLIDKEIYTRGWKSRDKLFGEDLGGSTHDWFGSTAQFNDMLKDTVPGFDLEVIAPPNGKEYTSRDIVNYMGVAIPTTSEKKEVAVKYLDFMFSEEGIRYRNFGLEGKHYDMDGDYPRFRDWVVNGEKTAISILEEAGASNGLPTVQDFRYEEQWLNESAKKGADMYINNNYIQPAFPILTYIDDEEERLNRIMTDVRTHLDEVTQKWVFGSLSMEESYDSLIEKMKELGIEEATKIQQDAYNRYLEMK